MECRLFGAEVHTDTSTNLVAYTNQCDSAIRARAGGLGERSRETRRKQAVSRMRPLPLPLSLISQDEEEADYKQLARWTKIRLVAPRKNLISPLYPAKVSQTISCLERAKNLLKKLTSRRAMAPVFMRRTYLNWRTKTPF